MALGIGVNTFQENGLPVSYQSLSLSPDLALGEFGIGLDITLNYRFANGQIDVRTEDWVPTSFADFFAIYLPKIAYVRWGTKGEPLYLKAGSFDDATLGNGFIMSNYSNKLFLPDTRIFGLSADVDGQLFGFPYVGIETVVGNLAAFDVLGARLFTRPLLFLTVPVIKDLEVGGTFVTDTNPYLYTTNAGTATPVSVYGADFKLPILSNPAISMAAYGDYASISANGSSGAAFGLGGRFFGILTYGAQFRAVGPGFIPTYFDATYDLFRATRYDSVQPGTATGPWTMGWLASTGFSVLDDKIVFYAGIDAPFTAPYPNATPADPQYVLNYPHLRGVLTVAEGIIPGISLDFSYDKQGIATWADLVSAQDAAIQAQLNYKTGPAVISLVYQLRYAPEQTPNPWVVTSGIQCSIELF